MDAETAVRKLTTFGGLAMFGMADLIIGPVIAVLCATIWDLYYLTFWTY